MGTIMSGSTYEVGRAGAVAIDLWETARRLASAAGLELVSVYDPRDGTVAMRVVLPGTPQGSYLLESGSLQVVMAYCQGWFDCVEGVTG